MQEIWQRLMIGAQNMPNNIKGSIWRENSEITLSLIHEVPKIMPFDVNASGKQKALAFLA